MVSTPDTQRRRNAKSGGRLIFTLPLIEIGTGNEKNCYNIKVDSADDYGVELDKLTITEGGNQNE